MQWNDLIGHQQQRRWFEAALRNGRLATSFLFVGPAGIGKRAFARLLAKSLLCRNTRADQLEACGGCEACVQVEASTHPDLIEVRKPDDKAFLPIELLIGEREKRMREGLCHDISMRPYFGQRKVAILDDADYLNVEGANCLLKTLEEPPVDSVLILIGTNLQRQLPTIRSRCQTIIFRPLSPEQLQDVLLKSGLAESESDSQRIADRAGGSIEEARLLADEEIDDFRLWLLEVLAGPQLPVVEVVKRCSAVVEAAGKDARNRRERLKLVLRITASFYRAICLELNAQQHSATAHVAKADHTLATAVAAATSNWRTGSEGATKAWASCLTAIEHVDRNVNQAALLESWVCDLAFQSGR